MTENENMVVNNETPPEEGKKKRFDKEKFKADFKEWGRKQIVNLKRRPSNIAFFFLIVTSLIYVFSLGTLSQSVYDRTSGNWIGIATFVCTLFSVLSLVLYMNAFPKRKKMKIIPIVLCGLSMALMAFMDIMFYVEFKDLTSDAVLNWESYWDTTFNVLITHVVFLGITGILMATMPLYKAALMKINTRKEVESTVNTMSGPIDLEDSAD